MWQALNLLHCNVRHAWTGFVPSHVADRKAMSVRVAVGNSHITSPLVFGGLHTR